MKILPASPLPNRNPSYPALRDVVWDPADGHHSEHEAEYNARRYSREAILYKSQYFALEEMVLEAFEYVAPSEQNGGVFSIKFATIIKDACNIFELVCRGFYEKFFIIPPDHRVNIFNFLSLEEFLALSNVRLILTASLDQFDQYPEVCRPYGSISNLKPDYKQFDFVPSWWNAYNNIKHSNSKISGAATLANALGALAALLVLLDRSYGRGLVYGMASLPNDTMGFLPNAQSSLVFSPEV